VRPIAAGEIAERAALGEVAVVGDALAAAEVEAQVGAARAGDVGLGALVEELRDRVRAAAEAVEVDRHQSGEHVGGDVRHRRATGAALARALAGERVTE
jgi:hypothetical protein